MRKSYSISRLIEVFSILPKRDQKRLAIVGSVQSILALLDLLGIALIGVIAGLAVNGVRSTSPGIRTLKVLKLLGIENLTIQNQTIALGLLAAFFFVSKSLLTMYFSKRILYFLSQKSATISTDLVTQILSQHLIAVRGNSSPRLLYAATTGVTSLVVGVLGNVVNIISDFALCLVLGASLVLFSPLVSISSLVLFTILLFVIFKLLNRKSIWLTREQTKLNISSSELLLEVIDTYREAVVRNRRTYYAEMIGKSRKQMAQLNAEQAWMPSISKYIVEITVTMGTLILAGVQFASQAAPQAIGGLALFLAAGTRIAPSLLRIQQNSIVVNSSVEAGQPTIELLREFKFTKKIESSQSDLSINRIHDHFKPEIRFHDVTFRYPEPSTAGVFNLNFTITPGSLVAIVGPSGAGKTTLVDLMLGIHQPLMGQIEISKIKPLEAISTWPGAIGYVPQDVNIMNGSIRSNLGIGFPLEAVKNEFCEEVITKASLREVVNQLPNGVDSNIGEKGSKLSGGERQRLGIARALITRPSLLILDEATSALDGDTETEISQALWEMKGEITIILIAHRLTTVRNASHVIYMEKGEIIAQGSFEQVRALVPNFDRQAGLIGL